MKITLKDWIARSNNGTFNAVGIIDDWEKNHHGFLSLEDAVEKFGDCNVEAAVYDGIVSRCVGSDGKPLVAWDVWIDIPGMHIGYLSDDRLTIPGSVKDEKLGVEYAIIKGKKSGRNITVVRNGDGPYEIYVDSTGYIEYVTDCGRNPHYVWRGKKLTGDTKAVIWALRDEVWESYGMKKG